jgi:hypothetical protein
MVLALGMATPSLLNTRGQPGAHFLRCDARGEPGRATAGKKQRRLVRRYFKAPPRQGVTMADAPPAADLAACTRMFDALRRACETLTTRVRTETGVCVVTAHGGVGG